MNLQRARRILGITASDDRMAVKKKYRRLMVQFHPDAQMAESVESIRGAQEVNEAYEYLKKHTGIFAGGTSGKMPVVGVPQKV